MVKVYINISMTAKLLTFSIHKTVNFRRGLVVPLL